MHTDKHPLSEIGLGLRYLRERRQLVQQDIADKLGINKASVSRLEQPQGNPTTNSVGNYLRVLGASAQDLIDALAILSGQEPPIPARLPVPPSTISAFPEPDPPGVSDLLQELQESADAATDSENHRLHELIRYYRQQFIELHERVAVLQAELREK